MNHKDIIDLCACVCVYSYKEIRKTLPLMTHEIIVDIQLTHLYIIVDIRVLYALLLLKTLVELWEEAVRPERVPAKGLSGACDWAGP